jgi:outer membrane lipoprotein-sorting protein
VIAPAATPAAISSPAPQSAADVLRGIAGYWKNLKSYKVAVTMSGSVKVSFISLPFTMTGTEYYRAPDRQALHMNDVPSLAKGFETTMASMGTPETWPLRYDITLQGTRPHNNHTAYVLVGTPKNGGNVKNVTMLVNAKTFAIESVLFSYNNGATLNLDLSHRGLSPYHLPTSATVGARFPQYSGNADITYGTYDVNVPIPDSVFQGSSH